MAKASKPERELKVTSFKVYTDTKRTINTIAAMQDTDMYLIVEEALQDYIEKWKKQNPSKKI